MSARCGQCRNRIVQKSQAGWSVRIQGAVTFDADGVCHARCFFCKADVVVPLVLEKSDEPEFTVDVTRVQRART